MADAPPDRPPEAMLPLTELWFNILLALADSSRHGYAIIKEIERRTEGRVHPATGTVYLALQRLAEDGLIEERAPDAEHETGGRRRRFYQLTPVGRRVMALEAERLAQQLAIATDKRVFDPSTFRSS